MNIYLNVDIIVLRDESTENNSFSLVYNGKKFIKRIYTPFDDLCDLTKIVTNDETLTKLFYLVGGILGQLSPDKHINDIYNKFLKRIYLKNPGNKYNLNIEKVFLHKLNLERDINIVFKYKERKVRSKEEVKILIHDIFTNVFNMLESKDFISLSDFKEYLTQFIIEE